MTQWDKQHKQDIDSAFERIEVPESLFTFAKELPYRLESELSSQPNASESTGNSKRRNQWMRLKQVAIATVVTLTLTVSIGSAVSPTFAEYIKSLFDRPTLDTGLQSAAKQGFSQETQASVTDQGITLKVKEVLADSNRLIFTYSIENQKGETLDPLSLFEKEVWGTDIYFQKGKDTFTVIDENGKEVSTSILYETNSGRDVKQSFKDVIPHAPYADMTFSLNENQVSKKLFVAINIHEINSVKGKWELKVPVDLEKSLASTKEIPIQQNYTTPDGLRIDLQKVTFSPTATSFDIQTEWTKEAKEKMQNHPEFFFPNSSVFSHHRPHYQILDGEGTVLGTSRAGSEKEIKLQPVSARTEEDMKKGEKTIWHQSYAPFSKEKKLFFKLIGIERTEYPGKQIVINPKTLKEKPVTLEYNGTRYTFTNFSVDKEKNQAVLEAEQIVTTMGGGFKFTDEQGKEYMKDYEASKVTLETIDPSKGINKMSAKIVLKGFTEIPEQLTITLTTAGVYYDNVDWLVEIPQP
ncbi:DUF4179 domain-containing protein [Brevibacillus sp. SYSU BS000544]|uniref:DUF4179 domain-containing protein n=1 Tax=Brevibacillus sp. SYSU BS000544 TaxID=3416443 RepID=UPI003CE48202